MVAPTEITHSDLVRDLRLLREKGLLRLRGLELPALDSAARATGLNSAIAPSPTAVERLVRRAVDAMGDEEPGQAAQYLFGLAPGSAGQRPTHLREKAAMVYRVSAETFRKDRERLLVARVAEEILTLCHQASGWQAPPDVPGAPAQRGDGGSPAPAVSITTSRDQYTAQHQVNIHEQTTYVQTVQVSTGAPEAVRCALPPDTLVFAGRDDELRQILDSAAAGGGVAVHAIDGMPGIGKTALAIHAAHLLTVDASGRPAGRFPDGQLFLDLRAHTPGQRATSPADALATLLIADGLDPRYLPETVDGRCAIWRDRLAGRRVLLVLDNAADTAQVAPLLPGLPGCLTLITSRRRLGDLPGGTNVLALDGLRPDQARAMFLNLITSGPNPRRVIGDDAVGELVELAAHLPLAISLLTRVFTQHPSWTMGDLLHETRTRLLTMTAEYATVAAAFDLSYDLLPLDRQAFFRRIGLHPGVHLEADAAAVLCGTSREEAITYLDALHRDHLVIEVGYRRYGLHDLIRSYLIGRAEQEPARERGQALARLLTYYQQVADLAGERLARQTRPRRPDGATRLPIETTATGLASSLTSSLAGSNRSLHVVRAEVAQQPEPLARKVGDRALALAWIRTERPNLLACIALARSIEPGRLVTLTASIAELLRLDGPWGDACLLHGTAADVAQTSGDWFGEAEALTQLGQVRTLSGDVPGADAALARARELFDRCGDRLGETNALSGQAGIQFRSANYADATLAWQQALARYQALDDLRGEANTLTDLGTVQFRTGDSVGAADAMERALTLHQDLDNPEGEVFTLTNLAIVHYRTGNLTECTRTLRRAVTLSERIGDRRGEANALTYLGAVLRLRGDYPAAIQALTPALDLHRELGHQLGVANTLLYLGSARLLVGDREQAAPLLDRTLRLYQDLEDPLGEANTYLYLGVFQREEGDLPSAWAHLERALRLYREIGDSGGEVEALNESGTLHRRQQDLGPARADHERALELSRRLDSPWDEANALVGLARCEQAAGRADQAVPGLHEAMTIFRRMGVAEAGAIARELDVLASAQLELDLRDSRDDGRRAAPLSSGGSS